MHCFALISLTAIVLSCVSAVTVDSSSTASKDLPADIAPESKYSYGGGSSYHGGYHGGNSGGYHRGNHGRGRRGHNGRRGDRQSKRDEISTYKSNDADYRMFHHYCRYDRGYEECYPYWYDSTRFNNGH
ncbi:hypothetical protein BGZ46_003651 [Entomortierella lignicola]|nr:hypothetical protein BGZ46_003651 [Entomortierella lignicola]